MHFDVVKYVFVENVIFLRVLVPMMGVLALVALTGPWGPGTSRFNAVVTGLGLIVIAVLLTWMGLAIIWPVKDVADTNTAVHEFKTKIEITLFIVPFVTASVGTNLISHAITSQLTFAEARSTWRIVGDILIGSIKVLLFFMQAIIGLIGFTVTGLRYLFAKVKKLSELACVWLKQRISRLRTKGHARNHLKREKPSSV